MLFSEFVRTAEAADHASDAETKIGIVASFLRGIESDNDLYVAAVWFFHGPLPPDDPRTVNIGSAVQRAAYALLVGDASAENGTLDAGIFAACRAMAGSMPETIRLLLEARLRSDRPDLLRWEGLTFRQIGEIYGVLASTRPTAAKIELLLDCWRSMSPSEVALFHRIAGRGEARVGIPAGLFRDVAARAFDRSPDDVRYIAMVEGDPGRTLLRLRAGDVERTIGAAGTPVGFMLASPLEREIDPEGRSRFVRDALIDPSAFTAEEMLVGLRVQAHIFMREGEVAVMIFSRAHEELSAVFPEVAEFLSYLPPGTLLDGQLTAVDPAGTGAHVDNLHRRLASPKPTPKLIERHPARFVAYDLLAAGGESLLDEAYEERRRRLEGLALEWGIPITGGRIPTDWEDLEREFEAALARGSGGLVLKRPESGYEHGRRGRAWLKVGREVDPILAVIRYGTVPPGGRGPFIEFTFGVRIDGPGEPRFVNIGKASGTEEETAELNRMLEPLKRQRFGTTFELEPGVVCELLYDFIRPNPRTEAGYTLHAPRIRQVRPDLGPGEIHTLADLERRYLEDVERAAGR